MLSQTEENYLKAIYHLSSRGTESVTTNAISEILLTKPASVSDMLKKLAQKNVITYVKYQGVQITEQGKTLALRIIRKHRLWEVFLVNHLKFSWDEVHEIAEELEHIQSNLLIKKLDEFLGYPTVDPHGDPIPAEDGTVSVPFLVPLDTLDVDTSVEVASLNETSGDFLRYLDKIGIGIGVKIKVLDKINFDGSLEILIANTNRVMISLAIAKNINVGLI